MFLLAHKSLTAARHASTDKNTHLQAALKLLLEQAEKAKTGAIVTVMDKSWLPPSQDKHDYLSFGPYWWPNPETPDGLPYVRRDGLVNPETKQSDKLALEELMHDVEILTLSYFYTGREPLAQAAAARLDAWFLNPQTRMKPHLKYGQAVPGKCDGRGIGIIDTVKLRLLPDLLEMLKGSPAWTEDQNVALKQWMADYLEWLLTSQHGQDESSEHNNHGTWYDVQVALLALNTGREEVARTILQEAPAKRFAPHLAPDGSQPHELARTRSFSYSCYCPAPKVEDVLIRDIVTV